MNLGIKQKMFLVMLVGVLVIVLSMSLFVHWSIQRGFLSYVNTLEEQLLQNVSQNLQQQYLSSGGWDTVKGNRQQWRQLLRRSWRAEDLSAPDDNDQEDGTLPRPRPFSGGIERRLQLLDSNKQLVVGVKQLHQPQLMPLYAHKELIGYLVHEPPKVLQNMRQLHFVSQQKQSLLLIGAFMVAAAALLSLPLAHRLVKRVKVVAAGTHQLAAGDYVTRIPTGCNDELGQLGQDFNALASTLEKNEQARRDWIADISHELRTPLTILRGELEAIQDGVRQQSAETIDVLHSEVLHLGHLVDDLYELSLSDAGALNYHKITLDPLELITSSVAMFQHSFVDKGLALHLKCCGKITAQLFADPERLQQLLTNLLENSLRYTDAGGEVEVLVEQGENQLSLSICDSAPGVPPDELPRLFERLYRGESSRNRALGGRGLGLSLCQNIVAAHGGEISAQTAELGGLCVVVQLPTQKAAV
jgi:two-component system sensor histidine kinase BaeS